MTDTHTPSQMPFDAGQLQKIRTLLKQQGLLDANGKVVDTLATFGNSPPKGAFAPIYAEISKIISAVGSTVDPKIQYWFSKAADINNDVTSDPADDYIRGVTQYGLAMRHKLDGLSQSAIDIGLQQTSNLIGENVINEILGDGGIPDFGYMISGDISAAIGNDALGRFQQDAGGWGGSFYYWNAPLNYGTTLPVISVGNVIANGGTVLTNGAAVTYPSSLKEFYYANSNASADFAIPEISTVAASSSVGGILGTLITQGGLPNFPKAVNDAWVAVLSGSQAQTPIMVKAKLFADTIEVLIGRFLTGNFVPGPHSTGQPTILVSNNAVTTTYSNNGIITQNFGSSGNDSLQWQNAAGVIGNVSIDASGAIRIDANNATEVAVIDSDSRIDYVKGSGARIVGSSGDQDTLYGGVGSSTYVLQTLTTGIKDTIDDQDGLGSLYVGSNLINGKGAQTGQQANSWSDANGTLYQFVPLSADAQIGTMLISGGNFIGPGQIAINDFDLGKAVTDANGDLGIHLSQEIGLTADTSETNLFANGMPANQKADVALGNSQTFTVHALADSTAAQTIQLALSGGGSYALSTGATQTAFNGKISVTIAAGQDSATFSLIDLSNTNQADAPTLTATYTDTNGTVTSNTLAITFDHPAADPSTPPTVVGTVSTAPVSIDGSKYNYTEFNGDGLVTGNSGGNGILTGDGNSVINGSGALDVIIAGNGNNQIYANVQTDVATALTQAKAAQASGKRGDLISVGNGNNTIVGGNGNDAVFTGSGNNTLILGSGAVTVTGGVIVHSPISGEGVANWASSTEFSSDVGAETTDTGGIVRDSTGFNAPNPYYANYISDTPVGIGNDTIFGGTGNSVYYLSNGNNYLDAGGGNDFIGAGVGNNTIFGGIGNDTIRGAGGNNYINAESGNDLIAAYGGNNTIVGGTGNDTIFSGDNTSNWASSITTENNYINGGSGKSVIYGAGGNDTLIGGTGNVTIYGGDGTEDITGGSGHDVLYGGSGTDVIHAGDGGTADSATSIYAGSGNTTIYGGGGTDVIYGSSGTEVIYAGDGGNATAATQIHAGNGNVTVYGGLGTDQIAGGSGTDVLYAGDGGTADGPTTVFAGTGSDTLYGGAGVDILDATNGNNVLLVAGSGDATLLGGSGDDTLIAGGGTDKLVGGAGNNAYVFNAGFGQAEISSTSGSDVIQFGAGISASDLTVTAALAADGSGVLEIEGAGTILVDSGLSSAVSAVNFADGTSLTIAQLIAQTGAQSETIAGATGNILFSTGAGDSVQGGSGNDTLSAWGGKATLTAGSGNNVLYAGGGNDLLVGAAGNDTLIAGAGNDTLISGTGADTLVSNSSGTTFVVNNVQDVIQLPSSQNQNDTIVSSVDYVLPDAITTLTLTGSANLAGTGNTWNSVITGNAGNDILTAVSGETTLIAGAGTDTMIGSAGDTVFVVNSLNDVLVEQAVHGTATVQTNLSYTLASNFDNLILTGSANLVGTGNDLNNQLTANGGNDTLIAGGGNDTLLGGSGNDRLIAGSGNDSLNGGAGIDTLVAGSGNDVMSAQTGSTYVFNQGFGQTEIYNAAGSTLQFGAGIAPSDLTLSLTLYGNTPSIILTDSAGGTVTVDGGLSTANNTTYAFADGATLNLNQLIAQTQSTPVTLAGQEGNLVFAAHGNASLVGSSGNDTLYGWGNSDTLVAGSGNNTLYGEDANDILVGGTGLDTLYGGTGNDTMIAGTGENTLVGGQSNDTFMLTEGGVTTINSSTQSGIETLWLPEKMRLSDFFAVQVGQDLYINSNSLDTTTIINGYFNTQPQSVGWVLGGDNDSPVFLQTWVAAQQANLTGGAIDYSSKISALEQAYKAQLNADLTSIGKNGTWLDDSVGRANVGDYYSNNASGVAGTVVNYLFNGVRLDKLTVSGGNLTLSSIDDNVDTTQVHETTVTGFKTVPVYKLVQLTTGTVVDMGPPSSTGGGSNLSSDELNLLPNGDVGFIVPGLMREVQAGTISQAYTYQASTVDVQRTLNTYAITGDGGNDVIMMVSNDASNGIQSASFMGTVNTGDGNVYVNLGTTSSINPDFGAGQDYSSPEPSSDRSFIVAGAGNDTLIGTDGADTIVGGSGFDYMDGGLGTNTYYVSMHGDATDIIDDTGDMENSWQIQEGYGGVVPNKTLVMPDGLLAKDLNYRIVQDPAYPGSSILQINYGTSNVWVVYQEGILESTMYGSNPAVLSIGVNRIAFSDGSTMTLDQFMAAAHQMADDYTPSVSASDQVLQLNQTVAVSGLFTASDTGSNAITWYRVSNSGIDSGYFTLNGKRQSSDAPIYLTKPQLSGLQYVTGATAGDDLIQVSAFDGAAWSVVAPISIVTTSNNVLQATSSNQVLTGTAAAADVLIGGYANDTLVGGGTQDTFFLRRGDGNVVVSEASDTNGNNTLRFGGGVTSDDLQLTQQGSDVLVKYGTSSDSVLVKNLDTFSGTATIDKFQFADGSHSAYSSSGQGDFLVTNYDSTGNKTGDQWQHTDGTTGFDRVASDGTTETAVTTTNSDGSTYSTDQIAYANGTSQQSWSRSDGAAGSTNTNTAGVVKGSSSVSINGSQEIDSGSGHVLVGSPGADAISGSDDNALLIGGTGNDTITTGTGGNVIGFNLGDGQDTVVANAGDSNVLSLGGKFSYADLAFQKNGNNLILDVSSSDAITLQDWYASSDNQQLVTLQVIEAATADYSSRSIDTLKNTKVETFDFQQLVEAFDQAQIDNPTRGAWSLSSSLLDAHLSNSDTTALGGDLAYEYGVRGNLTGFNVAAAETVIANTQFATSPQNLHPWGSVSGTAAQIR
ncbi:beta strand repeat-containing protein [Collimonas fungivorans]|uniref:Calcium binding hemolysin protein, putative n=1 Tax=Collimonas fungivorans (strain Ter331) TaxID=1005048 RepID=G0AGP8_COLFT|nr:calcium-binding protein [Collimonas fungivorans]AEK61661.1 calcium binding hemolysin protein, putative [Collimonas fungivorans Ter331]